MAQIVVFHHAQGLTAGVRAFADDLRAAGHQVEVPDLYEGRTFADLPAGLTHVRGIGFDTIIERGWASVTELATDVVYVGMSLGVLPAQALAQNRAGARGALLLFSCIDPVEFGGDWPVGVPVQIHGMDQDPEFVGGGDLDAARQLVDTVEGAELFLYPGDGHLFVDRSLPDHDADAARLLTTRVLEFVERI